MLRTSLRCAAVAAVVVASSVGVAEAQSVPVPVLGPEPGLTRDLDAVVALSPPDTCLLVSIDGTVVYDHRGQDPQTPASVQKLITAAVALDGVDPQWRYTTRAVAAQPVDGGVVSGDLGLVGAGDPALVTASGSERRSLPPSRPQTRLDDLADQIVAAGVQRIEGSVVADERRYDQDREVASWPARHARQNLAGPLSALAIDRGLQLRVEDGRTRATRSPDPASDAAAALTWLLVSRGVTVTGPPVVGEAPEPAVVVADVASPPLVDLVGDLLARSDNTMAELVLKEIGARAGDGSTAGGAGEAAAWLNAEGLADPGAAVVDGSGLDTGNQVSCRAIVDLLEAHPELGALLPVAGRTGTLATRFAGTSAEGVLRAKTGSLNEVTSLAGEVDLPDGGVATFSYIANGELLNAPLLRAQDFLAEILARYLPPCPDGPAPPLVDPALHRVAQLGLATGGAMAGASPVLASSLAAMQARSGDLVDRCSATGGAAVVLAPTGRAN